VRTVAAATLVGIAALVVLGAGSAASAPRAGRSVLDVGDSLSVGAGPYLHSRLRGYRIEEIHDVGLHAYDAARIVSGTHPLPSVVVVSAGTNDDPRIVSTFIHSVATIVTAARGRCVVWPTIVRPPAVGATYAGINLALKRTAARHPNLVLVDWVQMVREHPWWLASDGVHVSVVGYRARAAAIAAAIASRCA
jgi:lysophospholipase L1-like esterase